MPDRIEVQKTYKVYIGGNFPRTESGRYYKVTDKKGNTIANACRCTRKDVRNAVVAARAAQNGWAGRSAYNRGQILYRISEMLEGRKAQFIDELKQCGFSAKKAEKEVHGAIDRLIHYAGWSDKYQQIFSTVNPVASSHFNFSMPDPMGVVGVLAPNDSPLLGLISMIAPAIVGGNTVLVLASQDHPLPAISFAEVLNDSDVPGGVVNILTGLTEEMIDPLGKHMDVNALFHPKTGAKWEQAAAEDAALNVKRIIAKPITEWFSEKAQSPYLILDLQEIKTTWHPVGS